jgi:hypothetical protein
VDDDHRSAPTLILKTSGNPIDNWRFHNLMKSKRELLLDLVGIGDLLLKRLQSFSLRGIGEANSNALDLQRATRKG